MQQIIQEEFVRILPKGLITIPKYLRVKLGFEDSSLARISSEKGRLIIEPVRMLTYPVRSYSEVEIKEFLEEDKKETKELKKAGYKL
ncbi:hypothetical protein CO165_00825 [Candidatus Roizmanbacteria bacterium CG_4_9_14_3_um_filter_33_18]|uniref:SpoVT-AbrB domain-containing protein n=2 Tax=Candidatus Roizmaniibacteriota TaxID=1752723 RepID=A0A2M7XZ10_9BACT|nr:MAG: hypothetical protein COW97_02045 [Candidatus Roizmanbacteria bacterium CG22_combo_CG10-13_8_21_14_all_34_12]PJA55955.1 MAG: hypothetical protein CO165_00825 [Candidatus Roizmanbacteria bacterium CG_4_9_14_3_um_filter_33_18]